MIPDASLPVNSQVAPNDSGFTINGGTSAGGNLFHSFQDFSVPTGTEAFFNNAPEVQNIITRITGTNLSHIDGLIRANGSANLFLLNPNGIAFGPNARLEMGGSFFGTTADSIHFADGSEFGVPNAQATPLLSINVPVGLQMGQNPGAITVQGTGHRLSAQVFTELDRSLNPTGLAVQAGNTLALIGGTIDFSGGIAAVEGGGHLEVGSVSNGQVRLNATEGGWVGDYSEVRQFRDIHLARQSLLDASGSNGSIQLQGRNIDLTEGSAAALQNLGDRSSGGITVNATESLNLMGNKPDGSLGSTIRIDNLGTSATGDITISAARLSIQDGGQIWTTSATAAPGGNLTVNVPGSIALDGAVPANPSIPSSITAIALNSGNGGNLTISTGNLRLFNSATLTSATISSGETGILRVNATDSIEIAGNNPITLTPSSIGLATSSSGHTHQMLIHTSRLLIRDGGLLGSSTLATGSAGSVTIDASESVEIRGKAPGSIVPSRIASTAQILDPLFQAAYGLPAIPSGDAGSLIVNTPSLRITDEGFVSVKNDGPGRAGDLLINANSILMDSQSSISASTASGDGGNIRLNLQQELIMRDHIFISARAAGRGHGGNLFINAPIIVGLENSDLVANAVLGRGGNIQIQTQGIFGLENRPQLTDLSDITVSSEFGVDGIVHITHPAVDPGSSLVNLSQEPLDPRQQVVTGCQQMGESQFIATGRGGVPANPNFPQPSSRTWSDVRDVSALGGGQTVDGASVLLERPERLVEATGWVINEEGNVELVVVGDTRVWGNFWSWGCHEYQSDRSPSSTAAIATQTAR